MALSRYQETEQGPWTLAVSDEDESDLHQHLKARVNNSGRLNFVPVDQFNVEHLPAGYQDQDLVNLVRAMSDLTVRVRVKYVSEDRPKTVPGSDQPYPIYKHRGRDTTRTSTGWISMVEKRSYEDDDPYKTCQCKECLNSPTPKTQFARIYIHTDAHVVYDELEGEHTTCHLVFDKGLAPDVCNDVMTLSGMSDVSSSVNTCYSQMTFVTHDMDLIDMLDKMLSHFQEISKKLSKMYAKPIFSTGSGIKPSGRTSNMLAIIVSHPHGCSKQVSVSQLTKRDKVHWSKNADTTLICTESCDAHMMMIEIKQPIQLIYCPRITRALIVTAVILCAITAVLTGNILMDTDHDAQINQEREMRAIIRQMSTGESRFTLISVSAHKQLLAPVGGENLIDPVFNDGHNVALLMSDKNDPLTEHAHGVNVTEDALIIQHSGLYYVYSSVHYKPVSDRPAGDFKYQSWFHYVHRTSATNPSNSGTLLQTAHSVCDNCTRNEETAFTGGNFYLEVGDKIEVCYSSLGLVQVKKESTFLGLIKLDSRSSEE